MHHPESVFSILVDIPNTALGSAQQEGIWDSASPVKVIKGHDEVGDKDSQARMQRVAISARVSACEHCHATSGELERHADAQFM